MGIHIKIENERAEDIRVIFDPGGRISWLLSFRSRDNTICLRFINPYGDTIFNQLQLPTLKQELESIDAVITEDSLILKKKNWLNRPESWPPLTSGELAWLDSITVQELRQSLNQLIALVTEAIERGPHIYVRFVGD